MRYIRMYKGNEDGAPGVTLYEIDADGWVHRQLQVHADGVRFSPEDILLRRPVSVTYMAEHPDAEEIGAEEFELHWAEFDHRRRFRERVPNPWCAWRGRIRVGGRVRELKWIPSGAHPDRGSSVDGGDRRGAHDADPHDQAQGWLRVPGFVRLFVYGNTDDAWATQRELFLEREIEWEAAIAGDLQLTVATRQIVNGPGLAAALCNDGRVRTGPATALA